MQIHFDAILKDNTSNSMTVRQLDALKKIDGHWRIIQQNIAVPVDQKTGAAVLTGTLPARGDLAWSLHPLPRPSVTPAQAELEIRKWTETMAVPATLDEAVSYYGPGDDVILYNSFLPGEHRGLREIRAFLAPFMQGVRSLEIKIPAFFAASDGGFGVQISSQELKLNKTDGTSSTMSFRQSDCLRRVDGKWYSFLELGNFPVDLKTGKLVLTQSKRLVTLRKRALRSYAQPRTVPTPPTPPGTRCWAVQSAPQARGRIQTAPTVPRTPNRPLTR